MGIFGNMFDFNRDGRLDASEQGMEWMALQELTDSENDDESNDFDFDDSADE